MKVEIGVGVVIEAGAGLGVRIVDSKLGSGVGSIEISGVGSKEFCPGDTEGNSPELICGADTVSDIDCSIKLKTVFGFLTAKTIQLNLISTGVSLSNKIVKLLVVFLVIL